MITYQTLKKTRQRGRKCYVCRLQMMDGNVVKFFRHGYNEIVYLKDKLEKL